MAHHSLKWSNQVHLWALSPQHIHFACTPVHASWNLVSNFDLRRTKICAAFLFFFKKKWISICQFYVKYFNKLITYCAGAPSQVTYNDYFIFIVVIFRKLRAVIAVFRTISEISSSLNFPINGSFSFLKLFMVLNLFLFFYW